MKNKNSIYYTRYCLLILVSSCMNVILLSIHNHLAFDTTQKLLLINELVLFSQLWQFQSAFNREKSHSSVSVGSGLDGRGIKV